MNVRHSGMPMPMANRSRRRAARDEWAALRSRLCRRRTERQT